MLPYLKIVLWYEVNDYEQRIPFMSVKISKSIVETHMPV